MPRRWVYTVTGTGPAPDGTIVMRDRVTIEVTMVKGKPQTKVLKAEFFLPEDERRRIDAARMEQVGRKMSEFYANHPESKIWDLATGEEA